MCGMDGWSAPSGVCNAVLPGLPLTDGALSEASVILRVLQRRAEIDNEYYENVLYQRDKEIEALHRKVETLTARNMDLVHRLAVGLLKTAPMPLRDVLDGPQGSALESLQRPRRIYLHRKSIASQCCTEVLKKSLSLDHGSNSPLRPFPDLHTLISQLQEEIEAGNPSYCNVADERNRNPLVIPTSYLYPAGYTPLTPSSSDRAFCCGPRFEMTPPKTIAQIQKRAHMIVHSEDAAATMEFRFTLGSGVGNDAPEQIGALFARHESRLPGCGWPVTKIRQASWAASNGICDGDELHYIGDQSVENLSDEQAAELLRRQPIDLTWVRHSALPACCS